MKHFSLRAGRGGFGRPFSRVSVLVLLALGALALPARAQTAPTPLDEPIGSDTIVNAWAVTPAGPSTNPTQPSERPYLSYDVVPGQVIHDAVTLYNYSNVPLTFRLLSTDAFNNSEGAFDVPPSDAKPTEVGSWVKLDQENLALPAKSQATVPITLTVPKKVTPGDHAGAIIASSAAVGSGPDGKAVNIDRRTGTRLYIRVAGALNPALAITRISNSYKPSLNPFAGRVEVTYRIENEGNVRLAGKQRATAAALLGLGKKSSKFLDVPELLPGQGITVKQTFKGIPALLFASAKADVRRDTTGTASVATVSRTAGTVAVPWTIVALIVIAWLLERARLAYRSHQLALA